MKYSNKPKIRVGVKTSYCIVAQFLHCKLLLSVKCRLFYLHIVKLLTKYVGIKDIFYTV